jgi:hypothetical protein
MLFSMAQLQLSRHLQFTHPSCETLWFQDESYDYSTLNLYFQRLDNILDEHNPEEILNVVMTYQVNASPEYMFYIEDFTTFALCDAVTFSDIEERIQRLITLLSHAIDSIETKYRAHVLFYGSRVEFHLSEQVAENTTHSSCFFFKPFGNYPLTQAVMESFFSKLDWWQKDSIVFIAFHKDYVKNHYALDPLLLDKHRKYLIDKDKGIEPVIVSEQEQALFFEDSAIMDKYLSQVYHTLIETIEANAQYQHAKAKVDLFYRINENLNLNMNENEHETGNSSKI